MAEKKNGIYCNIDANANVTSQPARPQEFGIPGTPEGPTCGVLEFTELYQYATVIHVEDNTVPVNGLQLVLGDDLATDGSSLWDDGAVVLSPFDSISVAISDLNKYVATIGGSLTLAGLDDVDIATADPQNDDVLTFEHGVWVPKTPVAPISDGNHIPLGDPDDNSFADGAVPLDPTMKVTEGIDRINEVLGKLVPAQPPAFPNGTSLTVTNTAGNSPRLATGVTDNSLDGTLSPGDAVTRITSSAVTTNTFNDVGPGDSGEVFFVMDGSIAGQHTLTGEDTGYYNGLLISDQKDYPPSTPGFWKSIDIQISGANVPTGINSLFLQHTGAGYTGYTYFVRDALTSNPVISGGAVSEIVAGTYAYSSSVPHYDFNASLQIGASFSNLAGETYYGGSDPFTISGTNGIMSATALSYADMGISTPIARQTLGATSIGTQYVAINGNNVHNSGVVQGTAKNVNGSATATLSSKIVLVKRGSAGSRVDENSIPVSGLGSNPNANNAVRVSLGSGDKPAGASSAWNSSAALATHEATVVAGVLKHDQTNYASGAYLPAGPNLSSGRSGAQYATFSFNRASLSAFKLAITGTYAGVWIKLPGISDAQPNGDGWWDAFQPYDGAGIPGEAGDPAAGCALGTPMTGTSGTFQITFGTASSTNSTGNQILVRVKLTAGQTILPISISN